MQNVGVHEIKNGPIDAKFTAMDQHRKPISVNDTVRIMEGPLKVGFNCLLESDFVSLFCLCKRIHEIFSAIALFLIPG